MGGNGGQAGRHALRPHRGLSHGDGGQTPAHALGGEGVLETVLGVAADANGLIGELGRVPAGRDVDVTPVPGAGLLAVLETCRGQVEYVALNPPPAREGGGMNVEMGGLEELIEAFQASREDDLFGLGGFGQN